MTGTSDILPVDRQQDLACALAPPTATGQLRSQPADFQVEEVPAFTPDGAGSHAYLYVEKRGINTEQVARTLARVAGVAGVDVGFAGRKDRHAAARQWFSVNLQGRVEPDWSQLESDAVHVLACSRHRGKLRRGALKGNRFHILVRALCGDRGELVARLERLRDEGVPNYFGEQRFGRGGANVGHAAQALTSRSRGGGRLQRSMWLSAARSALFNRVLSARVHDQSWNRALLGDVMVLDARRGFFTVAPLDEAIEQRVAALAVHPTGPLWGKDGLRAQDAAHRVEMQALEPFAAGCRALERAGVRMDRRALRCRAAELSWEFTPEGGLGLSFFLTRGSYATALLREVVRYEDVSGIRT